MNLWQAFKIWRIVQNDVSGVSMNNIKSLAWWEHAGALIASQAPAVASVVLGASNPITLLLSGAGVLGHLIYSLVSAHVSALQAVAAAGSAAVAASQAVKPSAPALDNSAAALQAVISSLQDLAAKLPPAPASAASAPASGASSAPAK